ncbi:Uncharacterised protein [Mycobacteroides abscessus subsp. abscessus]|nr:Uncharacterised protein [Mycobacteroides abscessus subsp. abscessus]
MPAPKTSTLVIPAVEPSKVSPVTRARPTPTPAATRSA